MLEEGDDEGDAYGEPDQELDPEEERVGSDEGTVADDGTDEASKGLVIVRLVRSMKRHELNAGRKLTRRARRERRGSRQHQRR